MIEMLLWLLLKWAIIHALIKSRPVRHALKPARIRARCLMSSTLLLALRQSLARIYRQELISCLWLPI